MQESTAMISKSDVSVIEGTVTGVIFTGNDGYQVVSVERATPQPKAMTRSETAKIVVTGHFYRVGKNDQIRAVGAWQQHAHFGPCFITTKGKGYDGEKKRDRTLRNLHFF
jgi:hypothetical protein